MGNTIRRVQIKHVYDDYPQVDWIGKYTNEKADWAICTHCGEFIANITEPHDCPTSTKEYNYFLPEAGGEEPGSEAYLKHGKNDFKRMEALNNGDWAFLGIIAKATIRTATGTLHTISSGGLWGIESDSDQKYLEEIGQEQLDSLKVELMALGFGKREINRAFRNVEQPE